MSTFYAQPYDLCARGFYFETAEAFRDNVAKARNDYGQPVEEFELQFIDGEAIDAALAEAVRVHQGTVAHFFEREGEWDEHEKRAVIIAVGDCGYDFDLETGDPNDFDIDILDRVHTSEFFAESSPFLFEVSRQVSILFRAKKHLVNTLLQRFPVRLQPPFLWGASPHHTPHSRSAASAAFSI